MSSRRQWKHAGTFLAAVVLVTVPAANAASKPGGPAGPQLDVRLAPWTPPRDGAAHRGDHFKRVLTLENTGTRPARIVADRRLLELTVRPQDERNGSRRARRRYGPRVHCDHPDKPRRVDDARIRKLVPGETYREWIDLRMYCWGRALPALRRASRIEVAYGYERGRRDRWVARPADVPGDRTRWIEGTAIELGKAPARTRDPEASIRVEMARRHAYTVDGLLFRVAVMAAEGHGSKHLYVRPDQWQFRVAGPGGERECGMRRHRRTPIVDFFDRVTRHRERKFTLEAARYCPDAFQRAGIYDVIPIVELPYKAEGYDLETVTGTFEGVPTPIRIIRGEEGYVEQGVD